jgi:hypothetical protein
MQKHWIASKAIDICFDHAFLAPHIVKVGLAEYHTKSLKLLLSATTLNSRHNIPITGRIDAATVAKTARGTTEGLRESPRSICFSGKAAVGRLLSGTIAKVMVSPRGYLNHRLDHH